MAPDGRTDIIAAGDLLGEQEMLEGKTAIVTGAGRGIGREIATRLAKEGAALVCMDLFRETVEETAKIIRDAGGRAAATAGDVTDPEVAKNVVSAAVEEFGKVDVLVNNAGITRDALVMRMSDEDWRMVLEVNLTGAFNFARAVSRQMLRQKSGSIVNIASIVGVRGNAGQVNYSASKAGLIGLTKSLAKELGPRGVRVNAVAPGYIRTQMTEKLPEEVKEKILSVIPMGRMGLPEEVAEAVLFLASDLSRYTTGSVVFVDGGMAM